MVTALLTAALYVLMVLSVPAIVGIAAWALLDDVDGRDELEELDNRR